MWDSEAKHICVDISAGIGLAAKKALIQIHQPNLAERHKQSPEEKSLYFKKPTT